MNNSIFCLACSTRLFIKQIFSYYDITIQQSYFKWNILVSEIVDFQIHKNESNKSVMQQFYNNFINTLWKCKKGFQKYQLRTEELFPLEKWNVCSCARVLSLTYTTLTFFPKYAKLECYLREEGWSMNKLTNHLMLFTASYWYLLKCFNNRQVFFVQWEQCPAITIIASSDKLKIYVLIVDV
jgi:hypothetical protein